ncbi:MAG: carboxymuconolactone decarboxylase family protein [Sandaracinaceae bacterium]|nr:carboxymuconolactone decarboxylase family protein [Sandaracinaceae bacterium]
MSTRLGPGGWRELGLVNWVAAHVGGLATRSGEPLRLITALGRHRALFRAWLVYSVSMMPFGRLPRRDTELVILRVAHQMASHYELAHHRRLARRAGLDDREIERVCSAGCEGWSDRTTAILTATDELVIGVGLRDESWAALSVHLDERELIELCLLVGHYRGLASTLNALGVAPEHGVAAASVRAC